MAPKLMRKFTEINERLYTTHRARYDGEKLQIYPVEYVAEACVTWGSFTLQRKLGPKLPRCVALELLRKQGLSEYTNDL